MTPPDLNRQLEDRMREIALRAIAEVFKPLPFARGGIVDPSKVAEREKAGGESFVAFNAKPKPMSAEERARAWHADSRAGERELVESIREAEANSWDRACEVLATRTHAFARPELCLEYKGKCHAGLEPLR